MRHTFPYGEGIFDISRLHRIVFTGTAIHGHIAACALIGRGVPSLELVRYEHTRFIEICVGFVVQTDECGHTIGLHALDLVLEDIEGTRLLDEPQAVDEQVRVLVRCSVQHSRAAEIVIPLDMFAIDRQRKLVPHMLLVIRDLTGLEAVDGLPCQASVFRTLQIGCDLRGEGVLDGVAEVRYQVNLLARTGQRRVLETHDSRAFGIGIETEHVTVLCAGEGFKLRIGITGVLTAVRHFELIEERVFALHRHLGYRVAVGTVNDRERVVVTELREVPREMVVVCLDLRGVGSRPSAHS